MKFASIICWLCLAALPAVAIAQEAVDGKPEPTTAKVKVAKLAVTPDGVEYGTFGDAPTKPAPALIVLSGNIEDSFAKPNFLKAGKYLAPRGWLCISIDLPNHGKFAEKGYSGLVGWGKRAAEDKDFVADFNERLKKVLDHLVEQKQIDSEKIVVTGTSRGGFLAIRYAAFDKRVKAAVGYASVTDLRKLKEFEVAASTKSVDAMNLEAHVDELVGRPVFIMIGDRDDRVSTDSAINFMRKLSAAATKANVPSQAELLVVSEPRGHSLPPNADIIAARWIYRVMEGRELPSVP